mgnify:CR=1 FL=1
MEAATKPDFMLQTFIRCSHDALWDALRDPGQIAQYHFLTPNITLPDGAYHYRASDGAAFLVAKVL